MLSVGAIHFEGSALAERVGQGEVGGCTPLGDNAWRLLQLAVVHLSLLCPTLPCRLVVGGDFEGGLTPAACPLGGAFALYGGFLLHIRTHV